MSKADERTLGTKEVLGIGQSLLVEGQQIRLRLGGASMFPYLREGDIATVVKTPLNALQPGHVVVFDRGDRWVAHRLMAIKQTDDTWNLISRGDSCNARDLPFDANIYAGQVTAVERGNRSWRIDTPRHLRIGRWFVKLEPLPQLCCATVVVLRRAVRKLRRMMR